MLYCKNPESNEPIMLLNKHVGFDVDEGMGIDGALFQEELLQLDEMGKKRIQVWINSPGGIVMDGYNIYNAILKSKTKVDTYCVGIAASIAAVIFQAGRKRYMADYGKLMYHEAHDPDGKKTPTIANMNDSLAEMISARVAKSKDEILAVMKKTAWIGAGEALVDGFCDEIEVSTSFNKKHALSGGAKAMWSEGNLILNSILNQTETTMKKVTNRLGLTDAANEDSILEAITTMENKLKGDVTTAEEKARLALEDATKAKNDLTALQTVHNTLKSEKEAADKIASDAVKAAGVEKVKNMIDGFVKTGRIKNEVKSIERWTNMADKVGFDETKAMIEELPMNGKAVNITTEGAGATNEAVLTNVVASTMAETRAKLKM